MNDLQKFIINKGAKPAFLRYSGFPNSICASIDDVVVHGIPKPEAATIKGWLLKDDKKNIVRVYDKNPPRSAKEIITKYKVVAKRNDSALIEVELLTGRTHQIRAHMAHIGHPLVGDGKYGVNRDDKRSGYKFQALYAYRLRFDLPEEAGSLNYLRGREFVISPADVWFTKGFDLKGKGIPKWDAPVPSKGGDRS